MQPPNEWQPTEEPWRIFREQDLAHTNSLYPLPPEPVWWNIQYASGGSFSRDAGTWDEQAFSVVRDGATLSFSKKNIASLTVRHQGTLMQVVPPRPRKLFAFTRCAASPASSECITLYTAFGYLLPDYRVMLYCTPQGMRQCVEPRSTPISFSF